MGYDLFCWRFGHRLVGWVFGQEVGANHFIGKLKTAAQMIAIPFLLFNDWLFGAFHTSMIGRPLIWIASVLTVWSMFYYLQKAWPLIKAKTDPGSL